MKHEKRKYKNKALIECMFMCMAEHPLRFLVFT